MPRVAHLLAAVAGFALLAGLALARRDRVGGPAWRRRLVAAGLGLLAALGFRPQPAAAEGGAATPPKEHAVPTTPPPVPGTLEVPPSTPAQESAARLAAEGPGPTLDGSPRWRRIRAVWTEAEEVASGRRGPYPFDLRGKEKLLADLAAARDEVRRLREERAIAAPEAALAGQELARLEGGVLAMRPTEARSMSCYKPAPVSAEGASLDRLRRRLPLLEQLAGGELHPEVVRKLVAAARADLAAIARTPPGKGAPGETARAVEDVLRRLEARLPPEGAP